MFGDNAADNCQSQPCAAFASRKIGIEDAFTIGRWDASTSIGYDQLDDAAFSIFTSAYSDAPIAGCVEERLRGVINQIYQHLFDLFGIDHYPSQASGQNRLQADPIEPLVVELNRIDDHIVQRSTFEFRIRQSREIRKLVDHSLKRRDFRADDR